MTRFTKVLLTLLAVLALVHFLAGDWLQAGFMLSFGFLFYLFDKAVKERDKAREEVAALEAAAHSRWLHDNINGHGTPALRPTKFIDGADYMVTPEQFERILEVINSGHRATSVGGITPHLCVCGMPLEEHQ